MKDWAKELSVDSGFLEAGRKEAKEYHYLIVLMTIIGLEGLCEHIVDLLCMLFPFLGEDITGVMLSPSQIIMYLLQLVMVIVLCVYSGKRSIYTLTGSAKWVGLKYMAGLLISICLVFGGYHIAYALKSISRPQFVGSSTGSIIIMFLFFVLHGAAEEFLYRGALMTTLARTVGVRKAVIWSSMVFGVLYSLSEYITPIAVFNVFLLGVFLSLVMIRFDNIWIVCGIHTGWSFILNNMMAFLTPGEEYIANLWTIIVNENRMIWSGGAFGPESGLACTIVLVLAIVIILGSFQLRKIENEYKTR